MRTYLVSKFAKAAQISACIAENCSCLPLDGYSGQLFAPQRSSGWHVHYKDCRILILTLSDSDTLWFWHFPFLTLSNSDTF